MKPSLVPAGVRRVVRMVPRWVLLFFLLGLTTSAAAAPRRVVVGPKTGDWEFTLGGSGSSSQDFESGGGGLSTSLGAYLSPEVELVLRQNLSYSDFGDSSWYGQTRMALDYHFDLKRWRPFVGGNIGGLYGDDVADSFAAGLEGGLKYYVNSKTFIFGLVEYQWLFGDTDEITDNFGDGSLSYSIGIGFNF